jgi:hypothetical protein
MFARLVIVDSIQSPLAGTVMVLPNLAKTTAHSPARLMIADAMQIPLAVEMISKNNKQLQAQLFPKNGFIALQVGDITTKDVQDPQPDHREPHWRLQEQDLYWSS